MYNGRLQLHHSSSSLGLNVLFGKLLNNEAVALVNRVIFIAGQLLNSTMRNTRISTCTQAYLPQCHDIRKGELAFKANKKPSEAEVQVTGVVIFYVKQKLKGEI